MCACRILQFVKQDLKAKQFNIFGKLRLKGYVTIFFLVFCGLSLSFINIISNDDDHEDEELEID